MKEFVKLGLNLNITIWHWYQPTPPTEEKDVVAQQESYSTLEKLCDAIPKYDMKTIQSDFKAKVWKES